MKKLLLLCCVLAIALSPLAAIKTGKSIFYADSYMLRAHGVEAAYWNPANIDMGTYEEIWLPGVNTGIYVNNNALDLDTYNYIMGKERLDDADKELILGKLDGSLRASFSGNSSIIGYAVKKISVSSSLTYVGKMALSEQYLDLMLYGNTDKEYIFDKHATDIAALSFTDFTLGMGGYPVPYLPENFPPIRFGFSASLLAGVGDVHLDEYNGIIRRSLDSGLYLYQDVDLHTALGGVGFKGMLGFASNPLPNLEVGLTLDNIFGGIYWSMLRENQKLNFEADSIYIANIDEDFYTQTNETVDIPAYTTTLPMELRMAALWTSQYVNLSTDYTQGFKNSLLTSKVGKLSFGAQFIPVSFLPVSFGIELGNSKNPWRTSYGISLRSVTGELGIALQSYDSIVPGYKSKGIAFGSFIRIWF
ncbi:MAG: hypothetical protein CVU50_09955 [Candidatus Cloacimonetes bacterium HGW-Cloacimonetes-3]|jgi:hypothetical protein|nr:MAG: hypothetical protein CVU50_09955 [Candidatus Cloacimonetes bacterium HGW-Cloacimonetes-3]